MTLLTVHQRITESSKMSGCDPCLWIHKDGTVYTHIIRVLLNEFLPPGLFYIILKLYTEISIIPCIRKSTVDL